MIPFTPDRELFRLLAIVIGLVAIATVVGFVLGRTVKSPGGRETIANVNARTRAWWIMVAVFGVAVMAGGLGSIALFAIVSLLAFREFVTIAPTKRGDHYTLFWSFAVLLPLQYYLLWIEWYGLFAILIPVYGFVFVAIRSVLSGDTDDFLARTGAINWGLMVCVYFVSYAPALLIVDLPGYEGQNPKLLFFFVLVVQISDVLQYVFGKLFGRHRIAPSVSPNKTWEGLIGGVTVATLVGASVWWATPFSPLYAGAMALLIATLGFTGGLVMSAIKRDRGVKDFGTTLEGHGGVLDRIDSLCFAAPVFFHATRFFFGG